MSTSTDLDNIRARAAKPGLPRRHFLAMVGGSTAAAVGLAACGPDGPDGDVVPTSHETLLLVSVPRFV